MDVKDKLFKLGEDVKNSAGKIAKGAIDGSKKVAEKVKIKNAISQAESRMNALYIDLGKKYEELYAEQGDAEFAELLTQLADARAEISQAKIDLAALDSASICSNCGKYVQEGQRFCPNCGTKQPEPVVETEEACCDEADACEACDGAPEACEACDKAPEAPAEETEE